MVRSTRSLPAAIRPPLAATSVRHPPVTQAISPRVQPAAMPRHALPWPARPGLCLVRCGRLSRPRTQSHCHGAARLAPRGKRARTSARWAALLVIHLLQEWRENRGPLCAELSRLALWLPLTRRWLGWAVTSWHLRLLAGLQWGPVRPPFSSCPAPLVLRPASLAQQLF
jgi:hypothetical protein